MSKFVIIAELNIAKIEKNQQVVCFMVAPKTSEENVLNEDKGEKRKTTYHEISSCEEMTLLKTFNISFQ